MSGLPATVHKKWDIKGFKRILIKFLEMDENCNTRDTKYMIKTTSILDSKEQTKKKLKK